MAWHSVGSGNNEIHARRWTGQAWEEIGQGAASSGGISNTVADSFSPRLAFTPSGEAILAWQDGEDGDNEIYVRTFPACHALALDHAGNGSDPGPGLNHSTGCGLDHYLAGESISLTANPTTGWRVAAWSGTDNDDSVATTNTVTMPADDHTVSVIYEEIPIFLAYIAMAANDPVICFLGPNELEPNSLQDEANGPLCNGQTYHGRPDDFYDVFYFDMPAAGPIAIELNDFAAGGGQLGLLSAAFAPIAYDVTPGDGFRIDRPGEVAGRYYVVVHAAAPDAGAGPYALRAIFTTR